MVESVFILPKSERTGPGIAKIAQFLGRLPTDKAWRVAVQELKKSRSGAQNRYLWGVAYPAILEAGGEILGGWTADDLHEYFLGEHFGWETIEGFGRRRMKPLRRSSKLTTMEFSDFVASIQRKAAELGIYVPDPNEETM